MSLFDSISQGIQNHFGKKDKEREMMERLQKEADAERRRQFEESFRENAKEVAISKAKEDAAKKSGLQSLRATNRARRLTNDAPIPGTMFGKLSEFTQKNKARMEENKARTAEMRAKAEKLKEERLAKIRKDREQRMASRGNSLADRRGTWKM